MGAVHAAAALGDQHLYGCAQEIISVVPQHLDDPGVDEKNPTRPLDDHEPVRRLVDERSEQPFYGDDGAWQNPRLGWLGHLYCLLTGADRIAARSMVDIVDVSSFRASSASFRQPGRARRIEPLGARRPGRRSLAVFVMNG